MGIFSRKKFSKDYAKETKMNSFDTTNLLIDTEILPVKKNVRNDQMTQNSTKCNNANNTNQANHENGALEAILVLVITCGCVYTLIAFTIWVSLVGLFVVGGITLSQINQEELYNFRLNMVRIKKITVILHKQT